MRTVTMNQIIIPTQEHGALTRRLGGHLWARLMELEPCGMTVLEDEEGARSTGVVSIAWHKGNHEDMVQRLAEGYHIYTSQGDGGACVTFSTAMATFADIDYVQGAVWEILEN